MNPIEQPWAKYSSDQLNAAIANTYGEGINPIAVHDLLNALKSCLVAMEGQEAFPGHNNAYMLQVCLPRAKAAIEKAKLPSNE
jgi:hypothetical protein